ncbi:MAG: cyclic nucleotide-binding domain-containing protein [Gaiellaceae bacterium]
MSPRAEDLRAIPLLSGLDVVELEKLAAGTSELEAPAGQALIHPGATGTGMFFVVEGTVEVDAREGHRELGPGEFFGELALLSDEGKRTARVRAKTPVRCIAVDRAAFEALLEDHPEVAASLLEAGLGRLD